MSSIPFDGIITLLIFLVGLPALIVQFMPAEVRRVVYGKLVMPAEVLGAVLGSLVLIVVAAFLVRCSGLEEEYIWGAMFFLLLVKALVVSYWAQGKYGRRERVIYELAGRVYRELLEVGGRKRGPALRMIVELGKQSSPGTDRDLVLGAMKEVVEKICKLPVYQGDQLQELINGVTEILSTRPEAEGLRNYKTAVELLTVVLRPPQAHQKDMKLIDQQQAVRALSEIGQSVLLGFKIPTTIEYILMEYVQAFRRAAGAYSKLAVDITQALFDVGAVAVDCRQYFFAVMAFEHLRAIIANPPPFPNVQQNATVRLKLPFESYVDLLALMAHFWAKGGSLREFVDARREMVVETLPEGMNIETALEKAAFHCKRTLKFTSADHLDAMRAAWAKLERSEGNPPFSGRS